MTTTTAPSFGPALLAAARSELRLPAVVHVVERPAVRLLITLGAHFLALACAIGGVGPAWLTVPAVGVTTAVQLNNSHEWMHRRICNERLQTAVLWLCVVSHGLAPDYWRAKHNRLHHVGGIDGSGSFAEAALDVGNLARLAPGQEWRWWHRAQVVYFPLVTTIEYQQLLAESVRFARTGRIFDQTIVAAPSLRWKVQQLGASIGGPVALFILAASVRGMVPALAATAVILLVTGAIISSVLAVEIVHRGLGDARDAEPADRWVRWHLERSMCINTHPVVEWLLGGLNRHTEHHLLPSVASRDLRRITPVLRAECARHGIPFYEYRSLRASWAAFFGYLWELGKKPLPATHSQDANSSVLAASAA